MIPYGWFFSALYPKCIFYNNLPSRNISIYRLHEYRINPNVYIILRQNPLYWGAYNLLELIQTLTKINQDLLTSSDNFRQQAFITEFTAKPQEQLFNILRLYLKGNREYGLIIRTETEQNDYILKHLDIKNKEVIAKETPIGLTAYPFLMNLLFAEISEKEFKECTTSYVKKHSVGEYSKQSHSYWCEHSSYFYGAVLVK